MSYSSKLLQTTVGFVGGRFSKNEHYVLPVEECPNLSPQTKIIVNEFTLFVEESGGLIFSSISKMCTTTGLETFNEFERKGTWKMLTVREMSGDVLLIVTVFPVEDKEKEEEAKAKLIQRLLELD